MNKSFRGELADGDVKRIRLSTNDGLTGYKIKKFQVITADTVGAVTSSSMIAVYTTGKTDTGADRTALDSVTFNDPTLLAAIDYRQHSNEAYGVVGNNIIFDDKVFNQDIYITHKDNLAAATINFYLELEQVKLSKDEAAVATLKDMRAGPDTNFGS